MSGRLEDLQATEPAADDGRRRAGQLIIPFIVAIGFMMEQLDTTIITTSLPQMAAEFHTSPVTLNIAITAYLLSIALFIPLSGWVADRWGMRRTYIAAMVIFTIGSILCGSARGIVSLSAMRILQGLGGAMMTPVGRLILLRSFKKSDLVRAMTYMTLPVVVGPVLGPVLGGMLTEYLNWRWIFFVNVPIGLCGILLALIHVREYRQPDVPGFDWRGFMLCGSALVLVQAGTEALGMREPVLYAGAALLAAGICVFFLYARRQTSHPYPALDLSLFRIRSFRIGAIAGGVSRMGFNSISFLLPLLLQVGFGFSPVRSGLLTFLGSLGTVIVRPVSGRLLRIAGFGRLLASNSVLGALMILPFTLLSARTPPILIVALVVALGVLRGLQFTTLNTVSFADIPEDQLSRSTSLSGMAQQLSMGLGVSMSAALLQALTEPHSLPSTFVFRVVLCCVATVIMLVAPAFLWLRAEDGAAVSGFRPRGTRVATDSV